MANNTIITMDSLKKGAVRVYTGMKTVWPQYSREEILNVSDLAPKFNGCYAMNNSTVCFVSKNEIFVTPYTRKVMNALISLGFQKEHFYVPFSNGDYPLSELKRWYILREIAKQSDEEDFLEDCNDYCDEHHIGSISEETLKNCFEMPVTGVRVRHLCFDDCCYPVGNATFFDSALADKIGHYCTNNGKVVFVYRDGKTYVAKGYKILEELRAAGYTETGLFVPFSNGEQIVDPILRERWESITK